MKFQMCLATVFAAAVMLTGCSQSPEQAAQEQQQHAAVLDGLQQQDLHLFKQAGFEVVARSGMGVCNSDGEITVPYDNGANTDMTYILKKGTADNVTYTACVVHTSGSSSLVGLKSVEKYAVAPK